MIRLTVTEEQNRQWHLENIRAARTRIRELTSENRRREQLAIDDLNEALAWARAEGVEDEAT